MPNLTIAIIGFGSIAVKHLCILRELYGSNLSIDVLKRSKSAIRNEYINLADNVYSTYDKMLNYYDRVLIASPSSFHLCDYQEMADICHNFLIEKPISSDYNSALAMHLVEKQHNHKTIVGYVYRFSDAFCKFKQIVYESYSNIQSVTVTSHSYLPNWRRNIDFRNSVSFSSNLGGGVLRELSHELDIVLNLFGFPIKICAVNTLKNFFNINVEHSSYCFLVTENGIPLQISLSFNSHVTCREFTITCYDGTIIKWDLIKMEIYQIKSGRKSNHIIFDNDYTKMYVNQLRAFVQTSANHSKIEPSTVDSSISVMRLIRDIEAAGIRSK